MRILFLSQIIPFPPNAGPRVKTWHVLRYLAQAGHEVTLVSYVRPDEEEFVPVLRELLTGVHTVPIQRSRIADVGYWLRSHLSGRPWLIERDDLPAMRACVRNLLSTKDYDVVHGDQLTMTQFALEANNISQERRPFTIFDAHNATWTISARMFANAPWFLQPVLNLEANRIKRYEAMLVQNFDHTMTVIEPDRDALLAGVPPDAVPQTSRRMSVIPIAVDTAELQPAQRDTVSMNIVTLGSLHYPPNADGIRWFVRDVFPLIRDQLPLVTLTIIGKNPPRDFWRLAEQSNGAITITGYVPDLTPYMEKAAVMVVPVRAGGGMRVRLLEAFARGMPAVTTTIGLEGIEAEHGKEVLVADEPDRFAATTVRLLQDEALQQCLSTNSRILAEKRYDWSVVLEKMDEVFALAPHRSIESRK